MKIAITGASGLIGRALSKHLRPSATILRLVRREPTEASEVRWDPESGQIEPKALDGVSAVVHLAGQGVADQRWTPEFKRKIRDSRVLGTQSLARALLRLDQPPRVFVSASGVGYYGDTGSAGVDESAPPARTFLAQVCREWEAATQELDPVIRTVQLRIGMVLSPEGGALKKMLTPFRLGIAGPLGSGTQYVSWITLHDMCRAIAFAIDTDLHGPVNAVAPTPVTNREFTRTLAGVLHRPALLNVPAFALKAVLGELASEVLAGQRVEPRALTSAGFKFQHPELEGALRSLLG